MHTGYVYSIAYRLRAESKFRRPPHGRSRSAHGLAWSLELGCMIDDCCVSCVLCVIDDDRKWVAVDEKIECDPEVVVHRSIT